MVKVVTTRQRRQAFSFLLTSFVLVNKMMQPQGGLDFAENSSSHIVVQKQSKKGTKSTSSSHILSNFPKTSLEKSPRPIEIPKDHYKSQSKEDEKLMEWFKDLRNGTYLELGALDGVRFSNSYVFNKALNWKGVLIELINDNYKKLLVNRPNEITRLNAGVCSEPKKLHSVKAGGGFRSAVGGIWEFASPSFRAKWWNGIKLDDPQVMEIDCNTLDNLLLAHANGITYFDFLSLDVEGAELSVLQSIDFDRVGFGVIFFEADEHNSLKNMVARKLVESNGYTFLYDYERSFWFVNDDFYEIYKDLAY